MGWLWSGLGWVLLAAGLGVLAWALFWDRAGWRGRASLRCRGCWYDLTGVSDVEIASAHAPAVCPECGRRHRSRRALRRTRRRWLVAAVGLALALSSLTMAGYPKIQERGWWQAVPAWMLIASIPRMPGYVQNPDLEWDAIAWGRSSPHERAMANLFWRDRAGELGWLDYQLAAWMARTESEAFLCRKNRTRDEGVSPRASAYGQLIESGLSRGRLGDVHGRWFRRLVHVELRTRDRWPDGSSIFAFADVRRANSVHMAQHQIRLRFWSSVSGPFIVDAFGNVGNLMFTEEVSEIQRTEGGDRPHFMAPSRMRWSDGMFEMRARDPENGTASVQVRVSEFLGRRGSLNVLETLVEDYGMTVGYERTSSVEDLVQVLDSQAVREEIARCLTARAFWWHDALGRRHMAVALDLTGAPRLAPGRYTFGSGSVGIRRPDRRLAQGAAWWAIDVRADGSASMVYDRTFVPVYGPLTEQELVEGADTDWEVSIWSDPLFCLRDLDATQTVKGHMRMVVRWKHEPSLYGS